jgi:hypothetical protein
MTDASAMPLPEFQAHRKNLIAWWRNDPDGQFAPWFFSNQLAAEQPQAEMWGISAIPNRKLIQTLLCDEVAAHALRSQ